MKFYLTAAYLRDRAKLPPDLRRRLDARVGMLLKNPRDSSLLIKKVDSEKGIWAARIIDGHMLTLQSPFILRRIFPYETAQTA
jgi:hypothetical protein